jgi:hypothetical protein
MRGLKQQLDQLQLRYKDAAAALKRHTTFTDATAKASHAGSHAGPAERSGGAGGGAAAAGGAASALGGRAVVVRLAEAEAKVDQLTRALAKKGAYLEGKLKAEKERSAKQLANLKAQLGARRRRLRGTMADSLEYDESGGEEEAEEGQRRERLAAALHTSEAERRRLEHDLEYAVGALEEFKFRAAKHPPQPPPHPPQQEPPQQHQAQQQPPPPPTHESRGDSTGSRGAGADDAAVAATVAATVAVAVAAARVEERAAAGAARESLQAVVLALQSGATADGAAAVKVRRAWGGCRLVRWSYRRVTALGRCGVCTTRTTRCTRRRGGCGNASTRRKRTRPRRPPERRPELPTPRRAPTWLRLRRAPRRLCRRRRGHRRPHWRRNATRLDGASKRQARLSSHAPRAFGPPPPCT